MKTLAEILVVGLQDFNRLERPSRSDGDGVEVILKDLQDKGWIMVHVSCKDKKGKYVLRDLVHGGPIMLAPNFSEIYFNSLEFARVCRDAYQAAQLGGGEAPSILQIIEPSPERKRKMSPAPFPVRVLKDPPEEPEPWPGTLKDPPDRKEA